jgi:hypothetical protein
MPAEANDLSLETQLLDLQVEYADHPERTRALKPFGLTPDRNRVDIASEYGQLLRQFLKG